ncbi:MAG: hypothetical protein M1818_001426 [Claussenomyces sp. TS43310]|nr:MAG: hypothetical protein M1818_001426 [Claussenomyces sp. TS43310]
MPAYQGTFRIVPTTLVATGPPPPPMTSKAAKKAYRKSTALPRLSKAEQRRLEKEASDQQKKEYEREKAAARAKAAREKKQQKERRDREERRRQGIPEKSKWVRPSQPTIKGFVKAPVGEKRAWEDTSVRQDAKCEDHVSGSLALEEEGCPPYKKRGVEIADGDEFGVFPLPQGEVDVLLDAGSKPIQSRCLVKPTGCTPSISITKSSQFNQTSRRESKGSLNELPFTDEDAEVFAERVDPQLITGTMATERPPIQCDGLTKSAEIPIYPVPRAPQDHIPDPVFKKPALPTPRSTSIALKVVPKVGDGTNRAPLKTISQNMSTSRSSFAGRRDDPLKSHDGGPSATAVDRTPPPSTFAFLESHFHAFFPSPSQQVRELLSDVDTDDLPSNTQVARDIQCTHHTTQDEPVAPVEQIRLPPQPHDATPAVTHPGTCSADELSFLSQDLEISSQDLRDMDRPSQIHSSDTGPNPDAGTGQATIPGTRPRSPFFEEKEDDLMTAALHESMKLARQRCSGVSPEKRSRSLIRVKSTQSDYGDAEFGEGDLELLAAILDHVEKARVDPSIFKSAI